jgi:hypothetical protein
LKMLLFSALVDVAPTSDLISRIRMAYPQDPTACHLIKTTFHANPAHRAMAGLLYHIDDSRYRLYDDAGIIWDILAHHHDHLNAGHPGQNRMERTLKQHFYWPGLHEDVSAYVRSCRHCQLHMSAAQPPAPQTAFPFPSQPARHDASSYCVMALGSTSCEAPISLHISARAGAPSRAKSAVGSWPRLAMRQSCPRPPSGRRRPRLPQGCRHASHLSSAKSTGKPKSPEQ